MWDALPRSGDAYHAKYARNEIYALMPAFARTEPGWRTRRSPRSPATCVTSPSSRGRSAHAAYGYNDDSEAQTGATVIDLALFYGRNNLLINGDQGWVPGNVFGTVTEGLPEIATAAQDLWLRGVEGETLSFRRAEG